MSLKNKSESNIIRGIHSLLNKENVKPGINYDDIESKYISQGQVSGGADAETEDKYKIQLRDISQKLGLDFGDTSFSGKNSSANVNTNESGNKYSSSFKETISNLDSFESVVETAEDDDAGAEDEAGDEELESPALGNDNSFMNKIHEDISIPTNHGISSPSMMSPEFAARTNEELRHEQARSVMADMGFSKDNTEAFSMKSEEIQDYKINLLEEIDDLRYALEQIDPRVVERIPRVNIDSNTREIEEVAKTLRIKHDRYRYSTLADELLLVGVHGIEEVFNGRNVILGRWQPNLTGWHTQVKSKLRRMRYDTSSIVGGTMRELGLGSFSRVLLELIPNAFLYSNRNKNAFGQRTIRENVDQSIGQNIAQLNSI